jgi:hypothetical protein
MEEVFGDDIDGRETLQVNSVTEPLSHFTYKQKNIINDIIKDCYDNLKRLSK